MPEIESEVTFTIPSSYAAFYLSPDGKTLVLSKLQLTQTQIASLSWLVSSNTENMQVQIKVNP